MMKKLNVFKRMSTKDALLTSALNELIVPRVDMKKLKENQDEMIHNLVNRNVVHAASSASKDVDDSLSLSQPSSGDKNASIQKATVLVNNLLSLYKQKNDLQIEMDKLSGQQQSKQSKPPASSSADAAQANTASLSANNKKEMIKEMKKQLKHIEDEYTSLAWKIPNWTHPNAPKAGSEPLVVDQSERFNNNNNTENDEIEKSSKTNAKEDVDKKDQKEKKKDRFNIPVEFLDFSAGTRIAGPKFVVTRGPLVTLEFALVQLALHRLEQHGYLPNIVPDIVKSDLIPGCGFSPRDDATQIYHLQDTSPELSLAGTSEISLASSLAGCNDLSPVNDELPIRLSAVSHCFRREAGSKGSKNKGLYRLHQFTKVEMFTFCMPDQSAREQELMVEVQKGICEDLGLQWRVLDMPPHELGASAFRKYDVEVWLPGRKEWGEVASISDCTDFQSRRLQIKFKNPNSSNKTLPKSGYVHTVNGTGCAVPRLMLAILETHMRSDGSGVDVPRVLLPYMGSSDGNGLFIPLT